MAGLFEGLPTLTADQWGGAVVPVDTHLAEGQSPQSGLIPLASILASAPTLAADYTIGAESTNVRALEIQLKDIDGNDLTEVTPITLGVFSSATGTGFATGGSTGIAIGTDGALLAVVAKKLFLITSEADGHIDLTWTDTGTEAVYLGIVSGNTLIMSAVIANT